MVVGSAAGFLVNHLHSNTEIGSAKNFRGALSKLSIITDLLSVREWRAQTPQYTGNLFTFFNSSLYQLLVENRFSIPSS